MAQIAHGGIAGLFGSSNDVFAGNYFINADGYLSDSSGNVIGSGVFNEDIVALHRSLDAIILPEGWTSWIPDPSNNEWDSYIIGTAPMIGTATMVDGSELDLPSADVLQDDYDHDTVHYQFDPTAAAWQSLAFGETMTVTFTVFAQERNILGSVNDTDSFSVTLNFTKICFVAGTRIKTTQGDIPIEDIAVGSSIVTRDNGSSVVRWVGSSRLASSDRKLSEKLKPIRIRAGALGCGTPLNDLLVSPQHRILVRSKISGRMLGSDEVLVAAKHLLEMPSIEIAHELDRVDYFHILLDQHEIIFANGAETESLYLGREALKGLGQDVIEEIVAILPEIADQIARCEVPHPVRVLASARDSIALVQRHLRKAQELVQVIG